MASRDFRIGTEVAFLGRNTINSIDTVCCVTPFFYFQAISKRKRRKSRGEFNRYQKR